MLHQQLSRVLLEERISRSLEEDFLVTNSLRVTCLGVKVKWTNPMAKQSLQQLRTSLVVTILRRVGHKRCDCPQRPEAPGRGVSSNTGMVGAVSSGTAAWVLYTPSTVDLLASQVLILVPSQRNSLSTSWPKSVVNKRRNSLLVPLVMSLQYLKKQHGL